MVMCLPCIDASGFTGLGIYRGTFERLHKISKVNKQNWLPARVCPHWLFVLRSRPCSPEGGVKAPAVKPCIVYITSLPCSVGSKRTKCLAAITVVYPHCRLLHWWLTCEYIYICIYAHFVDNIYIYTYIYAYMYILYICLISSTCL